MTEGPAVTEACAEPLPVVGMIGLGAMGGAVAGRLLAAGYEVHGTSRTQARAAGLVERGLRWRHTPRAVAGAVDVLLTSLPDDDSVDEVTTGAAGVLTGMQQGAVWLDLSTVRPQLSREHAARVRELRGHLLDAPVVGGVADAEAGTLTLLVGGDASAYRRVLPLLRALGTPTHVGANGQGLVLKLAIALDSAVQVLALAEGLLLATRSGIDPSLALAVMTASPIGSPLLQALAPRVLDLADAASLPDETWCALRLVRRDVELAREIATSLAVPLPTAERAGELLARADELGLGDRGLGALYGVLQRISAEDGRAA